MAENKKSFILYADLIHTVRKMPKEKAGELFLTILSYVNDENPTVDDMLVDLVFEPIKRQMKRDLQNWEHRAERSRENGKSGGRPTNEKTKITQQVILKPEKPVTVNDTVTVTVTDSKEGILPQKNGSDVLFTIEHCLTVALNDNRWVKANTATKSDLEAFNKVLEKRGVYNKNPGDYKTHYANWVSGGKKENFVMKSVKHNDLKANSILDAAD